MLDSRQVIAVAPRLMFKLAQTPDGNVLGDAWGDTAIELPQQPARAYRDLLTGVVHRVDEHGGAGLPLSLLLRTLPVALLVSADEG